ncbi:hypothetical protein [Kribbella sp. NBC_00359]|uniref:hypothetical protein n=1 Tax=Kribbella sp. NBC_00359 TaxID=2975966 RepID=UPI002E243E80
MRELVVVTGGGELLTLYPEDDCFRWFFGSMGQLGIVVQVTLDIVPSLGTDGVYPVGMSGRVPATSAGHPKQLWWYVFTSADRWQELKMAVRRIGIRHSGVWQGWPAFDYPIAFRNFNPPLLYRRQESIVCVGVYGDQKGGAWDWQQVRSLDREFIEWSRSEPDTWLHVSTHLTFEDFDFRAHFGDETMKKFAAVKRMCDPNWSLVPGPLATALRDSE